MISQILTSFFQRISFTIYRKKFFTLFILISIRIFNLYSLSWKFYSLSYCNITI
uniref:Uncharacterized protein n=1 Tax=Meloidogyne enterolobii TaxID=390850 RepID=A0A6V7XLK4_MELEN|nr:unnamed protein product [Meloidogyne enterolobii]